MYTMVIEKFTCDIYDQNYEFVPISEFDYSKDNKFINQYDNILDLDMSEYKNLRQKIKAKDENVNFDELNKKYIKMIQNLDRMTKYPLINRELSLIEFDHILIRLMYNKQYQYTKKLPKMNEIKFDHSLLYSFYLVKEWIIEQMSILADDDLYKMKYVNNERFQYMEEQLLNYSVNYHKHLEHFIFKMRVFRPNKKTNFIVYFDILFNNYHIKYFINNLVIIGTDINENIHFADLKKNHYGISNTFNSNINIDENDIHKFIESKKKKEIYEYDRGHCFYKNANDKDNCISISKNSDTIGIYDSPCLYNEDCPFYKKNNNYPNKRGGCTNGYCEMPVNVALLGYKEYLETSKPVCYNCKKTKKCNGIECNMCCDDQKTDKYPNLNGPDYAFPNDFNERIKYSQHFKNNKLLPIKLIS